RSRHGRWREGWPLPPPAGGEAMNTKLTNPAAVAAGAVGTWVGAFKGCALPGFFSLLGVGGNHANALAPGVGARGARASRAVAGARAGAALGGAARAFLLQPLRAAARHAGQPRDHLDFRAAGRPLLEPAAGGRFQRIRREERTLPWERIIRKPSPACACCWLS